MSNWYVRRNRSRFWKNEDDTDKLDAYSTLYTCLMALCQLIAPFMPFLAEELYQNLARPVKTDIPDSVHLDSFPKPSLELVDDSLIEATRSVMVVCKLGRKARTIASIKVRQPLPRVMVRTKNRKDAVNILSLQDQVLEELNVKTLEIIDESTEAKLSGDGCWKFVEESGVILSLDTTVTPDLKEEGILYVVDAYALQPSCNQTPDHAIAPEITADTNTGFTADYWF